MHVQNMLNKMADVGANDVIDEAVFDFFRNVIKYDLRPGNPITAGLPLVKSPSQLIMCIAAYLTFVLTGIYLLKNSSTGKDTAQKRSGSGSTGKSDGPILTALVVVHNTFLVLLSLYMCVVGATAAIIGKYKFVGNRMNVNDIAMTQIVYVFYVSKIYEFLDTVIMIVKGSLRQVSFLHVYHHVSISFIWWAIAYNAPGGEAYLSLIMNSWVHVCMYSYYLLSTFIKAQQTRKRWLWWGKYLTQMQMMQFAINMCHGAICIFKSPYPKFYSIAMTVYMISLLVLFGHFYVSKYRATPKAAAELAQKKKK